MEKQLGWCESLGISKAGQTVLARLLESQIWHQLASSAAQCLGGREVGSAKGQWPLLAFLSGRKLSPSSRLDASHFSSFLYAIGAFQAATAVLDLGGGES